MFYSSRTRSRHPWYHFGILPCCSDYFDRSPIASDLFPKPREASDITDGVPFVDSESESDILIVRRIDPKITINGSLHHTSKYDVMNRPFDPSLVVRRGQSFVVEITLNRALADSDGVSFIFKAEEEEKPSSGANTLIAVPLMLRFNRRMPWNAVLTNKEENVIFVEITPSAESVVSKYTMEVDTKTYTKEAYCYTCTIPIYILFNPWAPKDQVFMKSDEWREECVLEESGLIWRGTANRLRPCIWQYGQFDKNVLDCSLYLVRYIGKIVGNMRGDPVLTARALAAAVNSSDDDGALVGNWTLNFEDGTAPSKWIGSAEILQKYYRKFKPVKYAQCWVFAGVLTTVCRTLGLPCRPITNYSSAHDTQNSLTVDFFTDANGKIMEELNSDSIWNFHVWNEAWMQRPDLGDDYGGWQAIDATPQEQSDNMYKCGPASVVAIKKGEIKRPYDCNFLFAEVNADKVYWKYEGLTQPLKLLRKDVDSIGKLMSTKAPGKFERVDITHHYKHPEKSEMERGTMFMALRQAENVFSRYYLNEEFNEVYFDFVMKDDIKIGEAFTIGLRIRNRSPDADHQIEVHLRADVVTYMGKLGDAVKQEKMILNVRKSRMEIVEMHVTYREYAPRLLDQAAFNISALCKVLDANYEYFAQDDFRVRKPDIKIVIDNPVEDRECHGTAFLVNPLPVALHRAEFKIQAPGLSRTRYKLPGFVSASGGKASVDFKFFPKKLGRRTIAAKFSSLELDDCDGFLNIWVYSADRTENDTYGD